MPINVLRKYPSVNNYLYYGIVFVLVGFQSVYAAQGERPSEQNSPDAQTESKPQPSPVVSPAASQSAVQQPQPNVEAQKGEQQPKTAFWDAKLTDWMQVGINAVLLLVVFWQAKINRDQRMTMHKQNEIMEGQNKIMEGQQQVMQVELEITRESVRHSERALIASEAQAEAATQSVLIAKESFYIGERPYFGLKAIGFAMTSRVPRVEITFENGGRTPAWQFHALVWLVLGDDPQSETRWSLNSFEPRYSDRYIPAGHEVTFTYVRRDIRLTPEQDEAIGKGDTKLFVVGTAHYEDMRHEKLHHNFTALWDIKIGRFTDWEG